MSKNTTENPASTSYSKLNPEKIINTLETLTKRIEERFPDRGLLGVCKELTALAKVTRERARKIVKPRIFLRLGVLTTLFVGSGLLVYMFYILPFKHNTEGFILFQGIEAVINTIVLMGAAFFSLWTIEQRLKRHQSLEFLNELNAITHVIDMHQLTKDPIVILNGGPATESSPERELSPFELNRYLDYCSEMLSLTAKLAAFYSQTYRDPAIVSAAGDIEQLTANMSRKIWQKIIITQNSDPKTPPTE